MLTINHFEQVKSDDVHSLREAALREEKAIIELSRRPLYNADEIGKRKIVLRSIKRILATHETNGVASA